MPILDWLLEDDAPGVAYLTRLRLLGESESSRSMIALRKRCNDYPPVAKMLAAVEKCLKLGQIKNMGWGMRGDYDKYRGSYWTLIFLADLYAAPPSPSDSRVRALADHVLTSQLDNGGFSPSGTPKYEIVCLTANILRALVHFGYGHDPRVISGYQRLAERIIPHGGVPCIVLETCLHTSCKMTLPQTLRSVAVAPSAAPKSTMKKLREVLVRQMLDVRVFQYVRPDVKPYREAVKARSKGVAERTIRLQWLDKHSFDDDELLPKPGWLRFGFPRSYNPDMLEAMLALAEIGVKYDPALEDALTHIEGKRLPDGRWKLDDSLNGKMLADIEKKGKPSKWITLRALTVLSHFGRAQFTRPAP